MICDNIVDSKDQIINYSSKTLKEAKRMNNIIIDMLNLSSIEQNYQKKQDIVKVDKALIEILDSLEDRIKARNISVITNIAKCETVGDAKLIDELIRNLIDNAIKYNVDNGKIMITLNTSTLTIEDTGIGISKEYQSRVFERFYRVDKGRIRNGFCEEDLFLFPVFQKHLRPIFTEEIQHTSPYPVKGIEGKSNAQGWIIPLHRLH